jgi:2-haloacid dehalogenase
MSMTYEWLLFDADGTLFDYDRAEEHALLTTFTEMGLPHNQTTTAVYRDINTQMWRDFEHGLITQEVLRSARFAAFLKALDLPGDAETLSEAYLRNLGRAAFPLDGAIELIQSLAPRFKLALITNGIPAVQRGRLALSPMGPYFESVTISGEVGYAKPDGRIFAAAFAAMGNPAKESVLLIGDSLGADIRGGNLYGLATCWYNPQGAPADPSIPATLELRTLAELPALLAA